MNVQELIDELSKIDDKTLDVIISYDMGMATDGIGDVYVNDKYNTKKVIICSVN